MYNWPISIRLFHSHLFLLNLVQEILELQSSKSLGKILIVPALTITSD